MNRILVADDESSLREMLSIALSDEGWEVVTVADGAAALQTLESEPFDVVISDIRMPGLDGMELLGHVKATAPHLDVILITAHASADSAIRALRLGAYDYVTKPFDVEELKLTVRHALERQSLRRENVILRGELSSRHGFDNIIGASAAMERVFELIRRVRHSNSTVLITGESGTGKELVARAVHYNGDRSEGAFVAVNCAALPAQLLESELFGHVKGAFTGADRHNEGLFEAAEGGTIFLDEIGDMPLEMQPKLLRVLESRQVRRVGATADRTIDVRVIAATNQDLRSRAAAGGFREDLYYRLNVIQIDLPPLRRRGDDVLLLADHLLAEYRDESGRDCSGFSPEAAARLLAHDWPGNVRELVNAVRYALTMETGSVISVSSLPVSLKAASAEAVVAEQQAPSSIAEGFDLEAHLEEIKRETMIRALAECDGVQTRAAERIGMSFRSFRYYAKKFAIES